MSDDDYISGNIQKHLCSVSKSDLYRVTTFEGSRRREDGTTKEITINILDRGPDDDARWMVTAMDEDGRSASSGNPSPDLKAAISLSHWYELDK